MPIAFSIASIITRAKTKQLQNLGSLWLDLQRSPAFAKHDREISKQKMWMLISVKMPDKWEVDFSTWGNHGSMHKSNRLEEREPSFRVLSLSSSIIIYALMEGATENPQLDCDSRPVWCGLFERWRGCSWRVCVYVVRVVHISSFWKDAFPNGEANGDSVAWLRSARIQVTTSFDVWRGWINNELFCK